MTIITFIGSVLSTPQEASMLIAVGIAAILHYSCSMLGGKRCEPGKLLVFVGSAAGMVAGVYVFFEALQATFSKTALTLSYQNAVWAGIGGACVALFTFDLMVTELKMLTGRVNLVKPIALQQGVEPKTHADLQSQQPTIHEN